jgi:hypothetical protein
MVIHELLNHSIANMKKVGVIGSMVWDLIYGRDPIAPPIEEWGGIAYGLSGIDAALSDEWQIVPLIKVGRDLAAESSRFLRTLDHLAPDARCVEVPVPNNRVTLRYESAERRCERMSGGVPGWTWAELGPMVRDLDAIYANFISGFEMCLGTAQALRQGFRGPIYADFHSLFLGMNPDGIRRLQPLPQAQSWFGCFDAVQMNEDEMHQLSPDPLSLAAQALDAGVSLLTVTLGSRGVAYVAAPGFDRLSDRGRKVSGSARTALLPAPAVDVLDPTGCGDVFGGTLMGRLLAGDTVEEGLRFANQMAARTAAFRGASGLHRHLRGELVTP